MMPRHFPKDDNSHSEGVCCVYSSTRRVLMAALDDGRLLKNKVNHLPLAGSNLR